MNALQNKLIIGGGILMAVAVGMGAFGAHALDGKLTPKDASIYDTANYYHFFHAFALFVLAAFVKKLHSAPIRWTGIFLSIGLFVFCGSLYALALSELILGERLAFLGMITPLGGLAFIVGWLILPFSLLGKKSREKHAKHDKE